MYHFFVMTVCLTVSSMFGGTIMACVGLVGVFRVIDAYTRRVILAQVRTHIYPLFSVI